MLRVLNSAITLLLEIIISIIYILFNLTLFFFTVFIYEIYLDAR